MRIDKNTPHDHTSNNIPKETPIIGSEPKCGPWSCMAILNGNARQVNASTLRALQTLLPGGVFLTTSIEDARYHLTRALDQNIRVIFAGGGDGTIIQTIQLLTDLAAARGLRPEELPMISVLPLGTGNALAAHFDIQQAADELALMTNGAPLRTSSLRLLDTPDGLAPFVGFGVDCDLTRDYIQLKETISTPLLQSITHGLPGYVMACLGRTIPRLLNPFNRRPVATFVNTSTRDALQLNDQGHIIRRVAPGDILFEGRVTLAAASTVSCYGFGLKFFPFAGQDNTRFQMRVYNGDVITPALRVQELFQGTWNSKRLHDFLADSVEVNFDRPTAVQASGDLKGAVSSTQWSLSPREVSMVHSDRTSFN